jgi:DNA polymerase alpha subunit B
LVAPAIARLFAENPSVSVIMVPSVRDVLDKHVAWPQDALSRRKEMRELGLPPAVRLVTNPITLSLNDAMLAVSTLDVLQELKVDELVAGKPPGGSDTLARLVRHIIEQRHYYPIFPPVDRSRLPRTGTREGVATGAVLDTGYLRLGEMCNVKPDIMLLPSAMPPFAGVCHFVCDIIIIIHHQHRRRRYHHGSPNAAQIVESVVAINPGTLSKRRGAGTYVKLALNPPIISPDSPPDVPVGHRVFERAQVEIIRI